MTMTMRAWIPGGHGMLGRDLQERIVARGGSVTATGHDVDITRVDDVMAFARTLKPTHIFNCAAHTKVDKAESELDLAMAINRDGARHVGLAGQELGVPVVHVSTDYVFPGEHDAPYVEDDAVGPLSAYGQSKLAGEVALRAVAPSSLIVRTSWLFGRHGPNFVATMLRLMGERETLRVVGDQRGRPTATPDLADGLLALVDVGASGVVHFADTGETTWHGFACAIRDSARARGHALVVKDVESIATSAYPTPAKRPAYSVLSTSKYTQLTGLTPPTWQSALDRYLAAL
jgi:dTDP-4-dehydrorhamnose reductase